MSRARGVGSPADPPHHAHEGPPLGHHRIESNSFLFEDWTTWTGT